MFRLLRWALNIALSVIIALVILYFLPADLKRKILDTVDSIITSPSERRDQIVKQLEDNLNKLQNFASEKISTDPNLKKIIDESKRLLNELKAALQK